MDYWTIKKNISIFFYCLIPYGNIGSGIPKSNGMNLSIKVNFEVLGQSFVLSFL